ncbi:MAG: type II toxin-antitoxin system RelB/DinJ family antitoxin [Butyrivibrio sp.]|nr:type II toxin-antitoxin system RelB/DinJ family antitoxin [Butyrivibrio sp.]
MAATTVNYTCRVDTNIKAQSEAVFNELGMNLGTAINVFLREAIRVGGFPFDVKLSKPNKETLDAILESEQIIKDPSVKKFADVRDALAELKK